MTQVTTQSPGESKTLRLNIHLVVMGAILLVAFAAIGYAAINRPHVEAAARPVGVVYPNDYRTEFVHYATIERGDGTIRDLYISPDSAANFYPGLLLPEGTILVIDGYHAAQNAQGEYLKDVNGRFIKGEPFEEIHVLQKRSDWQESEFPSEARAGDWNFGSFSRSSGEIFDEDLNACFHCHRPTSNTDFVYSYPHLADFTLKGKTQYFWCDLPERIAC